MPTLIRAGQLIAPPQRSADIDRRTGRPMLAQLDIIAAASGGAMQAAGGDDRSVRVPVLDLRAGDLRRLLRGVGGDAGPAHAADVGDQRDLVGDRGRRAARGRRSRSSANDAGPFWARALGFVALVFASVNIFGGFLVTQRMLGMYQKKKK